MTDKKKKTKRAKVQAFGGFLTNMVLPNIGAFIAWGIVTALYIETGWAPNAHLAELVGPTITYLLPLLLGYSGGKMVGGQRGGVLGSIATMGLIIGADIPMFLGAMIMGPLGGWVIKKTDKFLEDKIPTGFEMLINNFSIGILGFLLMILSYLLVGPVIEGANSFVKSAIEALVSTGALPLLSVVNEPAKVLFLNNVIDQGIYYPLGMQQTAEVGKSIYFMVASNPGTGLGLLLAYTIFGKGAAKKTAPGAIIIHFFGGIHELYFPYVLMKPLTIIAMILGGATGTLVFQLTNVGLVAGPSPGSIFAYLALTPRGNFFGVIAGVLAAALVSFLVTALILKFDKSENEDDFEDYSDMSKNMKSEGKDILNNAISTDTKNVNLIAFACDAGMGSSAMGAASFKKKLRDLGINDIEVKHFRIEDVPEEADIVVIHRDLADRLKLREHKFEIVEIDGYLQDKEIDKLLESLKNR